jgi:osomolarity two-component system, sensor histidine kinase CHK1
MTSTPKDSDISSELDLQSVMRASLAIQEGQQVRNIILKLVHIIMQTAGANYGVVMLSQQTIERKQLYVEVMGNGNKINLVDHRPLNSQTDVVPARLCEY